MSHRSLEEEPSKKNGNKASKAHDSQDGKSADNEQFDAVPEHRRLKRARQPRRQRTRPTSAAPNGSLMVSDAPDRNPYRSM